MREAKNFFENDLAPAAVVARMGVFVMKVGNVTENLLGVVEELGGQNVWSSEPSETVVNGVRIRRRMVQGDSLVFEAVSAQMNKRWQSLRMRYCPWGYCA